jgi:hypothetical protein
MQLLERNQEVDRKDRKAANNVFNRKKITSFLAIYIFYFFTLLGTMSMSVDLHWEENLDDRVTEYNTKFVTLVYLALGIFAVSTSIDLVNTKTVLIVIGMITGILKGTLGGIYEMDYLGATTFMSQWINNLLTALSASVMIIACSSIFNWFSRKYGFLMIGLFSTCEILVIIV